MDRFSTSEPDDSAALVRLGVVDAAVIPWTIEERIAFRITDRWIGNLALPICFSLGGFWWLILIGCAKAFPHDAPGTRFLVTPSFVFWLLPSLFLGILTAALAIDMIQRRLLSTHYARYEMMACRRLGIKNPKWVFRLGLLLIAGVLAGSAMAFHAGVTSFTRFADDGIEIRRPLTSRSEWHDYRGVKAIEHRGSFRAPSGKVVETASFLLIFEDGTSWSTREGLRDPSPALDERIARFVSLKTGRPIVERP